jgi:hypothetical protein
MSKKEIFGTVICVLLTISGCREEVGNQLKGKWQLESIEQNGNVVRVDTVWYNFQSESMFMYQIYRASTGKYIHQYGYKIQPDENTLQLELHSYARPVKDFLIFTDWEEQTRTFTVQKINGKQLILHSENKTYTFIRF